jgi:hypothetical protein
MKYKILSVKSEGDHVVTEVEYNFNGETLTVSVPHFRPSSEDDIKTGIENRAASEKAKIDAAALCVSLASAIETGVEISLNG